MPFFGISAPGKRNHFHYDLNWHQFRSHIHKVWYLNLEDFTIAKQSHKLSPSQARLDLVGSGNTAAFQSSSVEFLRLQVPISATDARLCHTAGCGSTDLGRLSFYLPLTTTTTTTESLPNQVVVILLFRWWCACMADRLLNGANWKQLSMGHHHVDVVVTLSVTIWPYEWDRKQFIPARRRVVIRMGSNGAKWYLYRRLWAERIR